MVATYVLGSKMRVVTLVLGGLLLVGGATLVVVSDMQRVEALEQVQQQVQRSEQRLAATRESNYRLAEQLTALRTHVAEQESQLADTSGFLQ